MHSRRLGGDAWQRAQTYPVYPHHPGRKSSFGVLSTSTSHLLIRSQSIADSCRVQVLASVVSFAVYAAAGHQLQAATTFTALSYFMLLRQPLMFLPRALSSLTDAQNALQRLTTLWEADVMDIRSPIEPDLDVAIRIKNATFEWVPGAEAESHSKKAKGGKGGKDTEKSAVQEGPPFRLENLSLEVPRGQLIAIVGPVSWAMEVGSWYPLILIGPPDRSARVNLACCKACSARCNKLPVPFNSVLELPIASRMPGFRICRCARIFCLATIGLSMNIDIGLQ